MLKSNIFLLLFFASFAFSAEKYFVQAIRVPLRESAKADAKEVGELRRGEEITVVETSGNWMNVTSPKSKGWVLKLFLSQHKPLGKADLANEVPASIEKASRKRSSSFAVAASARGLLANERGRNGRDAYASDVDALEKMEGYKLVPERLEQFRREARLPSEETGRTNP